MASASASSPAAAGRPAKADVVIRLATRDDVPVLASIADAAFRTDAHTQLKAAFRGADDFAEGMAQALASWVDHPKVDVVVAEQLHPAGSGKLVGWAGWVRRGFAGDTDGPLGDGPSQEPTAEACLGGRTAGTLAELGELTDASMGYWVRRFMPEGARCRYLCSYVVHPDFQSRGVGSRLMRWGTDKADAEPGVYCWVQSSMGGKAAFERQGFREAGRLEADLDAFAEGKTPGEENEQITGSRDSWGKYVWVYMRRDARA
ncbi:acetyltransferase [Colletotrichum graminicola]|uniref:Acetyltransferase n=1 Tax=Colletotrichum graminicola (strain M1.001 / M2 / FGSC 10212) TaxID=645133 RepID=E3QHT6_COLGM|nr:acetyltransferase [Colletotrichum graminicola M1.001]EFQ30424.1 acetyltransferase [Colletotrichum graminicola M1.001]WDK18682.1 acetyltransferase [Colletotrichum graminicola]